MPFRACHLRYVSDETSRRSLNSHGALVDLVAVHDGVLTHYVDAAQWACMCRQSGRCRVWRARCCSRPGCGSAPTPTTPPWCGISTMYTSKKISSCTSSHLIPAHAGPCGACARCLFCGKQCCVMSPWGGVRECATVFARAGREHNCSHIPWAADSEVL